MKAYFRVNLDAFIQALTKLADARPDKKVVTIPFEFSTDIDDSNEQCTEDATFEAWRRRCTTLISGINIPIGMTYIDAKGDETKRKVDVNKVFRDGALDRYFMGFCYLRENIRTFREDRIQEIVELETGEIVEPEVFFDRYGIFEGHKMEELQVIIHILSYLARADRSFIDAEKQILSEIIGRYCSGERKELVKEYVFNHRVQKQDYLSEVSRLRSMDPAVVDLLLTKAKELIGIDGKITKKEQEFYDILRGIRPASTN